MKNFLSIFVGLFVLLVAGLVFAKSENANSQSNNVSQSGNKTGWESNYNPRSDTARNHMSIVAKTVENLLQFAERANDPGIGEEIREIARAQGESSDKIAEDQDKISERSTWKEFFIGPDYKKIQELKQEKDQIRERVRELNQIRTQLQNEGDQTELQNQIKLLEMQATSLENYINSEEETFSLFGWLVKLFS